MSPCEHLETSVETMTIQTFSGQIVQEYEWIICDDCGHRIEL